MSKNDNQEAKLRRFCAKLLSELQFQVEDRSNSSLPELEAEANRLGVVAQPPVARPQQVQPHQTYPRSMMRGDFN